MLVRLLIYIKHNIKFLWQVIEWINGLLFRVFYGKRFRQNTLKVLSLYGVKDFRFSILKSSQLQDLKELLNNQPPDRLKWFKPHGFDEQSLQKTFKNPSFIMMGVFDGSVIVGYFFLRCFWNRKCFVGRMLDEHYEGKGIGQTMNDIMYNIGWNMRFKILSTISKNNHMVMKSHANNPHMKILKELDNDYLLVEFIRNAQSSGHRAQGDLNQY